MSSRFSHPRKCRGFVVLALVAAFFLFGACKEERRSEGQTPTVKFDEKGQMKTPVPVDAPLEADDNSEHLLPKEEFIGGVMPNDRKAQKLVNQLSNYTMALCSDNLECPEDLKALKKAMKEVYKLNWPNDPWGNPYAYTRTATDKFTIVSWGPDKTADTDDDVKISKGNE